MEEKYLKTTLKQRIISISVAAIMLITSVVVYILMILNRDAEPQREGDETAKIDPELDAKYKAERKRANELSSKYFEEFIQYRKGKSFNVATANASKVQKTDLKVGDGRELKAGDHDYYAYYIGYCADESIFDSSFNSKEKPTGLLAPIPGGNLIEGWNQGIEGMKLGGVREVIMPGELAYGESRDDICGMKNAPLKFIIMPIMDEEYDKISKDIISIIKSKQGKSSQ